MVEISGWSNSETSKLRVLAEEGLSAQQISLRLGKSRNSVVSKCRRSGIKLCRKSRRPVVQIIEKLPVIHTPELDLGTDSIVGGMDLGSRQCRAVIGEPKNGVYCGRDVEEGSYCDYHTQLYCLRPTSRRKPEDVPVVVQLPCDGLLGA